MKALQRIFFWLNPGQEPFARAIAAAAGADIAAAGSPERGKSVIVAAELGVFATDDLRTALISADCQAVIILAPGEFGSDSTGADVRALLQALLSQRHRAQQESRRFQPEPKPDPQTPTPT